MKWANENSLAAAEPPPPNDNATPSDSAALPSGVITGKRVHIPPDARRAAPRVTATPQPAAEPNPDSPQENRVADKTPPEDFTSNGTAELTAPRADTSRRHRQILDYGLAALAIALVLVALFALLRLFAVI